MSHAVVRGTPNQSQLYLDEVLDAVRKGDGQIYVGIRERREVNVAQILFYSMRQNPSGVYMINGSTGESITNLQLLTHSVPVARALISKDAKGRTVVFVMGNHQYMATFYYGVLFAGVVPALLEPNATVYELHHFFSMVEPYIVFCDPERYADVTEVIKETSGDPQVVVADDAGIRSFVESHSKDIHNFIVSDVSAESPAMLLPTSGSTGLPKAAILTHQGLVAQLPTLWTHYNSFPEPTKLAMLLSTEHWMTHSILMTTCPVYHVTLLLSPKKPTLDHALDLIERFKPTWFLLFPSIISLMAASTSTHQLASLRTVIVCGSQTLPEVEASLRKKLPSTANFYNGYGLTEMQSFVTMPDPNTPSGSNGKVLNIFDYKIVNDDGKEAEVNQKGELYIKSHFCLIKGYHKNEAAFLESLTSDGWLKTGDVFYQDADEQLYFVKRKKFWIKYFNYQISPEEVEYVIGSLPGVQECVVTSSKAGPAAAVTPTPDAHLTRELIHNAVLCSLSEYKKLRGGIVFVETLPHLGNGKIDRNKCTQLVQRLIAIGECQY